MENKQYQFYAPTQYGIQTVYKNNCQTIEQLLIEYLNVLEQKRVDEINKLTKKLENLRAE